MLKRLLVVGMLMIRPHLFCAEINQELMEGIRSGQITDVNSRTSKGEVALVVAARRGHMNIVRLLLQYGADVHMRDEYGYTPLIAAASQGHCKILDLLLKAGANINDMKESCSVLGWAAGRGRYNAVHFLLEHKALVNHADPAVAPVLSMVVDSAYIHIVKQLLRRGASVDKIYKGTPLLIQAVLGKPDIRYKIVSLLIDYGAPLDAQDGQGRTALTVAAEYGMIDIVRLLLYHGATVDAQNDETYRSVDGHYWDIMGLLVKHGADVNKDFENKTTPFLISLSGEAAAPIAIVRCFIEYGADLTTIFFSYGPCGLTLLGLARLDANEALYTLLHEYGVNMRSKDELYLPWLARRPLLLRILQNTPQTLDLSDVSQAKLNVMLRYAATRGDSSMVQVLLAACASPSARSPDGISTFDRIRYVAYEARPKKQHEYREIYALCCDYFREHRHMPAFCNLPDDVVDYIAGKGAFEEVFAMGRPQGPAQHVQKNSGFVVGVI